MIQYSPYIDGTIPAFTLDRIVIPFSMNPAVGKAEIKGFALQFKDMSNGEIINRLISTDTALLEDAYKNSQITFLPRKNSSWEMSASIETNVYYKIQLAYIGLDNQTTGLTYSSIGIGRCVVAPQVSILNLRENDYNNNIVNYIAKYQSSTPSEAVYSCQFQFVNATTGEIIADSGIQYHNSFNDSIQENPAGSNKFIRISYDEFYLNKELTDTGKYQLIFTLTTVNGYSITKRYYILKGNQKTPTINCNVQAVSNYENGYNIITLQPKYSTSKPTVGNYVLLRANSQDNYSSWDILTQFKISNEIQADMLWNNYQWKDFDLIHGVTYKYALSQFAIKTDTRTREYSNKIVSIPVYSAYEDLYLSDKDKQLAVRFNPKVSSFKEVIQESKVETIGGKYPFFFRNGQVGYKEIPISGLISYNMDNEELFLEKQKYGLTDNQNTQLTGENIYAEREFRNAVLAWLNNGQPKLFRSPTEGNHIVRLMNVSLSPNDTLGRMLYTFSATGYEMADYNYTNLKELGLINCTLKNKKQEGVFEL